MATTSLSITPGSLPSGFCPTTYTELQNEILGRASVPIDGSLKYVISDTVPSSEDRDKLWVKTSGGAPIGIYIYFDGQWVWPNTADPSGADRRVWTGSLTALETYDGGQAGAVGPMSGPMWEQDTDFAARTILGAGTLPVSSTAVSEGDTGGLEQFDITLGLDNLPPHKHAIGTKGDGDSAAEEAGRWRVGASTEMDWQSTATTTKIGYTRETGGNSDDAAEPITVNNMPPYRVVRFIKRTARIYYLGS